MFAWRTLHNKLPTVAYLHPIKPNVNPQCVCCHVAIESTDHLFNAFPFSKHIWNKISQIFSKPISFIIFTDWFWSVHVRDTVTWYIWKAQNNYIFNYYPLHPNLVLFKNVCRWSMESSELMRVFLI